MSAPKERPILFSAPMVRALLAGTKTQTRRIAKLTDSGRLRAVGSPKNWHPDDPNASLASPYGQPGDWLWVRETWGISNQCDDINHSERIICYAAGEPWHVATNETDALRVTQSGQLMQPNHFVPPPAKWKPSIFMRPWMSRITLEIVSVRCERLHAISEGDALAEGVTIDDDSAQATGMWDAAARRAYVELWEKINGPGSWAINPWVWVVEFRRVEA